MNGNFAFTKNRQFYGSLYEEKLLSLLTKDNWSWGDHQVDRIPIGMCWYFWEVIGKLSKYLTDTGILHYLSLSDMFSMNYSKSCCSSLVMKDFWVWKLYI